MIGTACKDIWAELLTQHSQGDDESDIEEQDWASLGQVSMPYVNKEVCNQDVGARECARVRERILTDY